TDCMAPAVVEQVPGPAPEQHKQIQHITLSADATFGFGSSTLRPLGIAALDDVVSKMQQAIFYGFYIVFYTDLI
ncbi:hypothetical protein M2C68_22535, partial [Pseudomonas sp. BAgro211]|nr:hypothetical protein [Pseudomonas sp. BAgro211]